MAENNPSSSGNKCGNGNRLLSDVPECYNYGVYFDDGYNYSKHVKSLVEFVADPEYEQMEDIHLPDDYVPPEVQPVYAPLNPDFEVLSDEEYIEDAGELEDNFIELAGGKHVQMEADGDDAEVNVGEKNEIQKALDMPSLQASVNMLPMHKVKMMERFLFGAESTGESMLEDFNNENQHAPAASTTVASMRKGRLLTDQEEILEKQFDKLMHKTKSRTGFDGRSLVSGTSVMSESLQSVVTADQDVTAQRHPKGDKVNVIDSLVKAAVLQAVEEMPEDDGIDPLHQWLGPGKPIFDTIVNEVSKTNNMNQPSILKVPRKPKQQQISSSTRNESDSDSREYSDNECSDKPLSTVRARGETAEEKKARKNALKAHKKERKQVKKMNMTTFRKDLIQAKANGQVRVTRIE